MPLELPGFYYDADKNRYFPIKGPIPGSDQKPSPSSSSSSYLTSDKRLCQKPDLVNDTFRKIKSRTSRMLHSRELSGNVIISNMRKYNVCEEFHKKQASHPEIWKYEETDMTADGALEEMEVEMQIAEGQRGSNVVLAGSGNGTLSIFGVEKIGQDLDYGLKCLPKHVWPKETEDQIKYCRMPEHIRKSLDTVYMPSNVSGIKILRKLSQLALVTTLGSDTSGGALYMWNFSEPIDYDQGTINISVRTHLIASLNCTIWASDSNLSGTHAAIGTNLGAVLVNLETGARTWVCRSKSDVLSIQFGSKGNAVLCGLRNGAVLTIDVRQRREIVSARLIKHRIPYPKKISDRLSSGGRGFSRPWFELKGNVDPSCTLFMPSSVSCLVTLQLYDQYFLASSMDGTIKLYDHRIIERGAVQTYDGNVNSHTRIQLGVDPYERFLISGGEDFKLRLWCIKSGELLFEDKFSNSIISRVCWPRTERGRHGMRVGGESFEGYHGLGAWLGSEEGLFRIRW